MNDVQKKVLSDDIIETYCNKCNDYGPNAFSSLILCMSEKTPIATPIVTSLLCKGQYFDAKRT